MARCDIFLRLRRRRRALGALFAYALLLNALIAAIFNVQAIASAIDPLSVAATCDTTGSSPSGGPVKHDSQHQPDCALCSSACPMGASAQNLGSTVEVVAIPPSSYERQVTAHRTSSVHAPSVYLSDADAQAPPAIG